MEIILPSNISFLWPVEMLIIVEEHFDPNCGTQDIVGAQLGSPQLVGLKNGAVWWDTVTM